MSTTASTKARTRLATRRLEPRSRRPRDGSPVVTPSARAPTAIRVEARDRHRHAARLGLALREAAAVVLLGKLAS
jgi:hypothetical protein